MLVMLLNLPAYAVPTSVSANGVIWTLSGDAIPGVSTTGSFTLTADTTGWDLGGTAYLVGFSLKNFGSAATISSLTAPSGTWDWVNEGLKGKGCKSNGTFDALCVFNNGSHLSSPSTADNTFSFTFDITLDDVFPDFTHLKVNWMNPDGKYVGDLISQDITWVPEPGIVLLLASGLLLIGVSQTHKKSG